jgi:hypothetical protein
MPAQLSRHLSSLGQPGNPLPEVTYHGGPLLQHVQVEAVYDGQAWGSVAGLGQQMQQLDGFLNYFVDSPYVGALKQYNVSYGTFLGHHLIAQDPPGGQTIDDSQIRALLNSEIAAKHLAAPTAERLYVFFTAPGVVVTADGQDSVTDFAGYHDVFTGSSGAPVYYAVVPYPMGQVSSQPLTALQQATVVLSHEISEAITDPDTRTGWLDPRRGEIGDITAGQIGSLHGYTVQALWSQVDAKAVVPANTSGTPLPGSQVHATAGHLRAITATVIGADFDAAAILGDGNATFSPSAPNQGQPIMLTMRSSGISGEAAPPLYPVALPSAATGTPSLLSAMALRLSQAGRIDSGSDDRLSQTLEDATPAGPQKDISSPDAVSAVEPEAGRELRSGKAGWREASTAYFTAEDAAGNAPEAGAGGSQAAAAAALGIVLGGYWSIPPGEPPVRRRRPARA